MFRMLGMITFTLALALAVVAQPQPGAQQDGQAGQRGQRGQRAQNAQNAQRANRQGNNMNFGNQGFTANTIVKSTEKDLFLLRAGVLVKYDLATLKAVKTVEFFGALGAQPDQNADRAAQMAWMAELAKRNQPAILVPTKDNFLLVVIGDNFARLSQETLTADVKTKLTPADANADANRPIAQRFEPQPSYELVGNTLYLIRSTEVLAIDATTGTVTARTELPKEFQPIQMNMGPGMLGNRANRGGAQNGAPNNPPAPPEEPEEE